MLDSIAMVVLMGANIEVVCMAASSSDGAVVGTCGIMKAGRVLGGLAPSCKQKL